jgi:hypothetical protein
MIHIGKILKRSWHILWSYRVLWIFGILLALTAGSSNGGSGNSSYRTSQGGNGGIPGQLPANTPAWVRQFIDWFTTQVEPIFTHPAQHVGTIVTIVAVVFVVILLFSVLAALVRYPAETAVFRMVDGYEQDGSKLKFKQGWKLGWNRRAFRLWVIDLILAIPGVVFILLMLSAGLIVYFSVSSTFKVTSTLGVVAAIGIAFVSILLIIVAAVFLNLLRKFFARAAALDGLGVKESLKQGWATFKGSWKSAALMWLVMIGIGIGFGIASLIAFFVLIPAYLVMVIPAALVAALPGALAYGVTSIFTSSPLVWIIALLAAFPVFMTIVFAPLLLVSGWYKIYESSVWTLTYREIKALQKLTPAPQALVLPAEGASGGNEIPAG